MGASGTDAAAGLAGALLEAAVLVESTGAGGLAVTCYDGRISISVGRACGDARARAALVTVLGRRAGAAGWQRHDVLGSAGPQACLQATGRAGPAEIGICAYLDAAAVPGGTLAASPGGARAVIAAGHPLPPGWRWVTGLDDQPAGRERAR
jgi:hypothetical protein